MPTEGFFHNGKMFRNYPHYILGKEILNTNERQRPWQWFNISMSTNTSHYVCCKHITNNTCATYNSQRRVNVVPIKQTKAQDKQPDVYAFNLTFVRNALTPLKYRLTTCLIRSHCLCSMLSSPFHVHCILRHKKRKQNEKIEN